MRCSWRVIGRPLMPLLVAAGHEVTGTTRSPERATAIEAAGATAAVVDALDDDARHRAAAVPDRRPGRRPDRAGPRCGWRG